MRRHPWDPSPSLAHLDRSTGRWHRLGRADPLLWLGITGLAALGLANLLGLADSSEAEHQLITLVIGLAAAVILSRVRIRVWVMLARLVYAGAVLLLLAVVAAGSHGIYGSRRWLAVGSNFFQPSEFAKIGLLLVLADVLGSSGRKHRYLIALGVASVPIALTLVEPDLSTAGLLVVIFAAVAIQARVRARSLIATALAAGALAPIGLHLLQPYQLQRLQAFVSGGSDALGSGWTVLQAHIAVASGGLLGQASQVPYSLLSQYLPARETDLALVSLVEQRGLLAGAAVVTCTALVMWRMVAITRQARTQAAGLVGAGFAVLLGTEVVVSAAGGIGLLPLAGVPCPLISAGGSAAVAHLGAVGIALGIARDARARVLWRAPRRLRRMPRLVRVSAAGLALSLVGTGVVMLQLQTTNGSQLRAAALDEVTRAIDLPAPRGEIVDRHGVPLVYEESTWQVVVVPGLLQDQPGATARLARLIGQAPSAVAQRVEAGSSQLSLALPGTVTQAVATKLRAAGLPGVILDPSYQLVDPYASLLGPLLGSTGPEWADQVAQLGLLPGGDIVGHTGLEAEYDSVLRGRDGVQRVLVDPFGSAVALSGETPPVAGGTVELSLDLGLQEEASALLARSMAGVYPQSQTGDWGAMIVMDAKTGAILAMAGQGLDGAANATEAEMPPGSTFKLVTSAADVAYDAIPPSRVIPTGCSYTYDGIHYANWECLPPQDLPEAIAWSNDVYFYQLALALGPQRIAQVAAQLGVGRLSGIDLPEGEQNTGQFYYPGHMPPGEIWYPGVTPMMGIGQGYTSVTPIQDIRWLDAVATGQLVSPHLGMDVSKPGDPTALSFPPSAVSFASKLDPIVRGLALEVTQGTGTQLRNLPQPAGGKTGTAQDPSAPHGGPDAWYDAVYPINNPQVAVLCAVHGGGQGYYACEPSVDTLLQYFIANQAQILSTTSPEPASPSAQPPTPSGSVAPSGSNPTPPAGATPPAVHPSRSPGAGTLATATPAAAVDRANRRSTRR
ncbi:MAG TPA: FtsW/RodA/SpoVE family cell cycle protein [Candidatus Binatia bacterium]|nr:FtsW/RodA/SpoVE family cell cycle protein [Candidatus Binatia bacterium]